VLCDTCEKDEAEVLVKVHTLDGEKLLEQGRYCTGCYELTPGTEL
jgi:hypothetical protein